MTTPIIKTIPKPIKQPKQKSENPRPRDNTIDLLKPGQCAIFSADATTPLNTLRNRIQGRVAHHRKLHPEHLLTSRTIRQLIPGFEGVQLPCITVWRD